MKYRKHLDNVVRTSAPHIDDGKIRLHAAERNKPWSDKLWQKYINNLKESDVRCYPDQSKAIDMIAHHEGVRSDQVTIGHGSDQIIKNIFECFTIPYGNVITTDPCFPMYEVYGKVFDVEVVKVPYSNQRVDIDALVNAINLNTSIVIVSNPNSPVGDTFSPNELQRIINRAYEMDAIVVIDEAYIEFSDCRSFADSAWVYPNVIVTKTFSKALGSAGMRFGYAITSVLNTSILNKVKNMYEVTGPTLKWIETVLDNYEDVLEYIINVKHNRTILTELLSKYYDVVPSQCNWVHTTKTDFPDNIITRQCTLPWNDKTWTRLCVPGDYRLTLEMAQP